MKKRLVLLFFLISFFTTYSQVPTGSLGIGVRPPQAMLDVNGELKVGEIRSSPIQDGMVQYKDNQFLFRQNGEWIPLNSNISPSCIGEITKTVDVPTQFNSKSGYISIYESGVVPNAKQFVTTDLSSFNVEITIKYYSEDGTLTIGSSNSNLPSGSSSTNIRDLVVGTLFPDVISQLPSNSIGYGNSAFSMPGFYVQGFNNDNYIFEFEITSTTGNFTTDLDNNFNKNYGGEYISYFTSSNSTEFLLVNEFFSKFNLKLTKSNSTTQYLKWWELTEGTTLDLDTSVNKVEKVIGWNGTYTMVTYNLGELPITEEQVDLNICEELINLDDKINNISTIYTTDGEATEFRNATFPDGLVIGRDINNDLLTFNSGGYEGKNITGLSSSGNMELVTKDTLVLQSSGEEGLIWFSDGNLDGLNDLSVKFYELPIIGEIDSLEYIYGEGLDGHLKRIETSLLGGDYIPLAGTESGKPVTGNIYFTEEGNDEDTLNYIGWVGNNDSPAIVRHNPSTNTDIQTGAGYIILKNDTAINQVNLGADKLEISSGITNFSGILGNVSFIDYYTDGSFVQKKYVDSLFSSSSGGSSYSAKNGIYINSDTIKLGGNITEPTVINLDTNYIVFKGENNGFHLNSSDTTIFPVNLYGSTSKDTISGFKTINGSAQISDYFPDLYIPISGVLRGNPIGDDLDPGSEMSTFIADIDVNEDDITDTATVARIMGIYTSPASDYVVQTVDDLNAKKGVSLLRVRQSLLDGGIKSISYSLNENTGFNLSLSRQDAMMNPFYISRINADSNGVFNVYVDTKLGSSSSSTFLGKNKFDISVGANGDAWENRYFNFNQSGLTIKNKDTTNYSSAVFDLNNITFSADPSNYTRITPATMTGTNTITIPSKTGTMATLDDIENLPTPPPTGTYILKSVDGVVQWVEE